jgi:signal transduction histidine kinase
MAAAQPRADVLVVDDEEGVLLTMQAILEMEGYRVATAQRGSAAIDLLRHNVYDVVLTDLRLDDLDGLTILAETRRTSPDTVSIMLTGYASLDSAVQAIREGAYDYLVKPCDVEELKATVARGVERRHLARQLRQRMAELEEANVTIRRMNDELQQRVDAATAELRQRLDDLAEANEQISALHDAAQEHVQQLEQLDQLKSQFLSMASHELKTPLTAISGFLQLALRRARRRLDEGRPDEDQWRREQGTQVDQLEMVNSQTFRLARLVDELLDVSRIESGKLELRYADVDLSALAVEIAARMRLTTPRHTIDVPAIQGEATTVTADRDYLEQVFNNLIGNAIKYSPDGGVITVDVRRDGESVLVSVRDQGVGIPKAELDDIFDLFYRSQDAGAQKASGLGLGLYISREIVHRHRGKIWAESTPGKGSTFYVSLPVDAPETSEPEALDAQALATSAG